jgi:transcriptional regulator with GAF, ATPase, and Fis domain
VARAIHTLSPRAKGPLEKLNCAALPTELIESELFGHEAGAFTGATKQRRGKFERASAGTLFLDEVGDMPLPMQAKLLRVLQEREIERVGGSETISVDVRVVAATNRDLVTACESGAFRPDLYDRINVLPLAIPPLRARREDIPMLARHFLSLAAQANDRRDLRLEDDAIAAMAVYSWPGNVRELKNVVERMAILSGDRVTIADLPEDPHESPFGEEEPSGASEASSASDPDDEPSADHSPTGHTLPPSNYLTLREFRDQSERNYIVDTLKMTGWNISRTAIILGVERTNLHKKIRTYQIKRGEP